MQRPHSRRFSRCGGGARLFQLPCQPVGGGDRTVSDALHFKLRGERGLLVSARPMTNTPGTHAMLRSKSLRAEAGRHKVFSKGGVIHNAEQRTSTRYVWQAGLYPKQVLDLCLPEEQAIPMANRLSHLRKKAGFTQEELGKALNSGRSTVTKLERGEIPMSDRWLERLAEVLKCRPLDILGDEVAIVGKIGAGGTIVFEDIGNEETTQRPPDTYGEIVGLEVVGESMLPRYDPGDIVYISRTRDGVDPNDIGAICACRLATGETYLKQVLKGSTPGLFTLRSYNAADMEDCELEWATPIRASIPRHARRFH